MRPTKTSVPESLLVGAGQSDRDRARALSRPRSAAAPRAAAAPRRAPVAPRRAGPRLRHCVAQFVQHRNKL
eukprot:10867886-Lingulodinium_polyedra.AAC.3